jgi:hypothetical protein
MKEARRISVLVACLALLVFLTGLIIVDINTYGVHLLDVVAVPLLVFLTIVVFGSLVRRPPR